MSAPAGAVGLFEMALEVADLAVSEQFYVDVIGLTVATRWTDRRPATWLSLGGGSFLGLWPAETGGDAAIHKSRGGEHVHFAIRVPVGTLDAEQCRIETLGVEVESGWDFGGGNRAVYLDDPDGNVIEVTERTLLWDNTPAE